MEKDSSGFVLENGSMGTDKWREQLPQNGNKTVFELEQETRDLLASGMAAKDVIPHMLNEQKVSTE